MATLSVSTSTATLGHLLETKDSHSFLAQMEGDLKALVGQPLDKKREFIDWLGSSEVFPNFVQALLQNPDNLTKIARRSFLHKNGFDVLQLFMTDDFELRIHIWPKQELPGQENIHNHRWDLASKILLGTLYQELFIPLPNTDTQPANVDVTDSTAIVKRKWFKCSPRKDYVEKRDMRGISTLYQMVQVVDNVGRDEFLLQRVFSPISQLKMDQSYSLDQSRFHRIVRKAGNEFTATLMINTGPYAPECNVFSSLNLLEENASKAPTFDLPEVRGKLEDLLKRFTEAHAR